MYSVINVFLKIINKVDVLELTFNARGRPHCLFQYVIDRSHLFKAFHKAVGILRTFFPIPAGCRVENNGFEPLTLCLQSRCSSQLS